MIVTKRTYPGQPDTASREEVAKKSILLSSLAIIGMLAGLIGAIFLGGNADIHIAVKIAYFILCFGLIWVGFSSFQHGARRICITCNELFAEGDQVVEVLGRNPGQFFACHEGCYNAMNSPKKTVTG